MSVTERMAEFIVETKWADFPALVIERAKKAVVDTVGVTLAGAGEPVGRIVADFAQKMGGAPEATIIGVNARAAAPMAALANGAMGHALDFDDSSYLLNGHPSVGVLPAVLAQGEVQGASGREVLEAFIIGYEISTKLGEGMNPEHYGAGWHATCTLGTMGAAAAAAHLRGLDVETTRHTLGCAASHASGVHANFGTMTKPLHAGLAPEAGLRAAALAARGPHGEHDHPGSPARIPGRLRRRRLPMRRGNRGESRAAIRPGGAGHEHEALSVLSIDPPGGGCAL